jgi:signal transduction histidine kinase
MEPLQQLAGAAGTISAQSWNFTPPPVARTATELAPLVSALEKLVARLRVSFAQQRRFVSDSAHELKTAVTVVKSSLQLLTLRERSPREYQAGLEVCLTDCARMEELVYRMLTLARLDEDSASRAEDRHEPARAARAWPATNLTTDLGTDLGAGAREAVASLESLARLRSIQLRCAVPAGLPGGLMSAIPPEDWQTLLSNLVVNAIQHSAPGGAVDIELAAEHDGEPGGELAGQPGRALCVVSDRGEGIAPEALPHVFDRFFRGDASRARSGGEAGLGLAIAKAIVDRAQGSISIDSTLGAGTRVRLSLPLIAAPRRQGLTSSAEIHR